MPSESSLVPAISPSRSYIRNSSIRASNTSVTSSVSSRSVFQSGSWISSFLCCIPDPTGNLIIGLFCGNKARDRLDESQLIKHFKSNGAVTSQYGTITHQMHYGTIESEKEERKVSFFLTPSHEERVEAAEYLKRDKDIHGELSVPETFEDCIRAKTVLQRNHRSNFYLPSTPNSNILPMGRWEAQYLSRGLHEEPLDSFNSTITQTVPGQRRLRNSTMYNICNLSDSYLAWPYSCHDINCYFQPPLSGRDIIETDRKQPQVYWEHRINFIATDHTGNLDRVIPTERQIRCVAAQDKKEAGQGESYYYGENETKLKHNISEPRLSKQVGSSTSLSTRQESCFPAAALPLGRYKQSMTALALFGADSSALKIKPRDHRSTKLPGKGLCRIQSCREYPGDEAHHLPWTLGIPYPADTTRCDYYHTKRGYELQKALDAQYQRLSNHPPTSQSSRPKSPLSPATLIDNYHAQIQAAKTNIQEEAWSGETITNLNASNPKTGMPEKTFQSSSHNAPQKTTPHKNQELVQKTVTPEKMREDLRRIIEGGDAEWENAIGSDSEID